VEGDEAESGPGRVASEQRMEGALDDAREHGDLEAAEDEEMYESGRDQGGLEVGRGALADAENHAEQNGRVGSGHGVIDSGGDPRGEQWGDGRESSLRACHLEAGGLELEIDIALGQVCAA